MSFRRQPRRPQEMLIMVADRGQARLFVSDWPDLETCREVTAMIHPEGRMRERETMTDGPGRFRTPPGQRASTEPAVDFRHQTANRFAHQLIERLEAGRQKNEFGRLVLVAPALFLGELRRELPAELRKLTVAEVDKDLVAADARTLLAQVREVAAAPA